MKLSLQEEIYSIEKRNDKTVIIFLAILLLLGTIVMVASYRYGKTHYQEIKSLQ